VQETVSRAPRYRGILYVFTQHAGALLIAASEEVAALVKMMVVGPLIFLIRQFVIMLCRHSLLSF
jgi:hypothetical protein